MWCFHTAVHHKLKKVEKEDQAPFIAQKNLWIQHNGVPALKQENLRPSRGREQVQSPYSSCSRQQAGDARQRGWCPPCLLKSSEGLWQDISLVWGSCLTLSMYSYNESFQIMKNAKEGDKCSISRWHLQYTSMPCLLSSAFSIKKKSQFLNVE